MFTGNWSGSTTGTSSKSKSATGEAGVGGWIQIKLDRLSKQDSNLR